MPVQANINEPNATFTYSSCYALEHIDVASLTRTKVLSKLQHKSLSCIPLNVNDPIIEKHISNLKTKPQRVDCDLTLNLTPAAQRRAYRNRTLIQS